MERVIVNVGTKTNLYELFEDLQDYIRTNQWNLIDPMVDQYGIFANLTPTGDIASTDTSMQVTGVGGQTYVSVNTGHAITRTKEFLSVPAGQTVLLTGLGDGVHLLYLKHNLSYDTPVDVMSGFAYGLSGIAKNSSRVHDFHQFVWDTNPVASGVALASVAVFAGTVNNAVDAIEDLRNTNVLKFNTAMMPIEMLRTDFTDTQTMDGPLGTTQLNIHNNSVIVTVVSGVTTVLTMTLAQLQELLYKAPLTAGISSDGTTSGTFRVGNSAVGADDGLLVQTAGDAPTKPLNIRITDIQSPTLSNVLYKDFSERLATPIRTGLLTPYAAVYLKWNWDDIQGCGATMSGDGSGSFTVMNSTGSKVWAVNELVGYHFWVYNLEYEITSHAATSANKTILFMSPVGHSNSIDAQDAVGSNFAWIHSNADSYEVTVIPVTQTGEMAYSDRYEMTVSANTVEDGPVIMGTIAEILLGEKVYIKVRAIGSGLKSVNGTMSAGTYYKAPPFKSQQPYDAPALIKLPDLDSTGVKVGAIPSTSGFVVTIVGWDVATDYEIAYTTDPGGASFTNPNHRKIITSDKRIDIVTTSRNVYYVAVRPLIAGQAVATPITLNVVSGAGDSLPKDSTIGPFDIKFRSYDGTLANVSGNKYTTTTTSNGGSCKLNEDLIGSSLYIGATPYIIGELYTGLSTTTDTVLLYDAAGAPVNSLSGAFTIGQTEPGRKLLALENLPMDIQLTKVFVEMFSKGNADPEAEAVLRWYQEGRKDLADVLILSSKRPTNFTAVTDLSIIASRGSRNLIFDLWDETGHENVAGLFGRITIYYTPVTSVETN